MKENFHFFGGLDLFVYHSRQAPRACEVTGDEYCRWKWRGVYWIM